MNCKATKALVETLEPRQLLASVGPIDLGAPHSPDDYFGHNVYRQHASADAAGNLLYVRQSGDGREIYGQWFLNSGGTLDGQGEFLVGTRAATAVDHQGFNMPQVDVAPTGRAVVSWSEKSSNAYAVYAKLLTGPADLSGSLVTVTTGKGKDVQAQGPAPAIAADGRFVVVWEDVQLKGLSNKDTIYAQRFDAAGKKQGSVITISPESEMGNYAPSVDMDHAGNFVVALPTGSWDIWARRYSSTGTALGTRFLVNPEHSWAGSFGARGVSVSMAPTGGSFVIGWGGKGTATPAATFASPYTLSGSSLVAHPVIHLGGANWASAAVAYAHDGNAFATAASEFFYTQLDADNTTEFYSIFGESFTPTGASLEDRELVVYGERYFHHPNGDGTYTETYSGEPFYLQRTIGLASLGNTGNFAVSYLFNPVFETRGEERQHASVWTPEQSSAQMMSGFSNEAISLLGQDQDGDRAIALIDELA